MTRPSTMLCYGASGEGKTALIGQLADYVHTTTGKITRLISADGGGWDPLSLHIARGIIDPIHLTDGLSALRALCRGEGDWISQKEDVGAYAFEGLTSFADLIMSAVKGRRLGQDPAFSFEEGGERFFGLNQVYYGFAQEEIKSLVTRTQSLPVNYVLWTALETKGKDEQGSPVYGPQVAGKATVARAPQWFSDTIHLESYLLDGGIDITTKAKKVIRKRYAWFESHPEITTGILYPAKARVPLSLYSELKRVFPGGFFVNDATQGLANYLITQQSLITTALATLKEKV